MLNLILPYLMEQKKNLSAGTRLSDYRNQNPEENVAAKYEDQADCFGNIDCLDPDHSALCLPWVQLWKMSLIHAERQAYIMLLPELL